jgi:Ras-related protein Rab-6A
MTNHPEIQHKVVFLGDSHAGKTSIIFKYLKLVQQPFPTIAASSFPITVNMQETPISLNCWDTAGQEFFRALVPMYARDAEVACLVYDQSNRASFEALGGWLTYIKDQIDIRNIIIVSNKTDLEPVVPLDEAFEFCNDHSLPLVATSALTGSNITYLFVKIAELICTSEAGRVQVDRWMVLNCTKPKKTGCCS